MKGTKVKLVSLSGQAPDAIFHKAVNVALQEEFVQKRDKVALSPNPSTTKAKSKRKISKASQKKNRKVKK